MRRPRRNHSSKFKSKVALAALKGEETLAELSERFDIHSNQISQWKNQLLERVPQMPWARDAWAGDRVGGWPPEA
jgi:transposase-like protein